MTDLLCGRLSATVPDDLSADAGARVDRMLHHLPDRLGSQVLTRLSALPGEWCLRRLDLVLPMDADATDPHTEELWAEHIIDALLDRLASGHDVVHYPHATDALVEAVADLARREPGHAWAWRQIGVLHPGDPDPQTDARGAALTALARFPEQVGVVLARAADRAGLASLHRLLGNAGWQAVARLLEIPMEDLEGNPDRSGPLRTPGSDAPPLTMSTHLGALGARDMRLLRLVAESGFGTACLAEGLRPSPGTARVWAAVVLFEVDPGRCADPALLAPLSRLLIGRQGGTDTLLGVVHSTVPDPRPSRLPGQHREGRHQDTGTPLPGPTASGYEEWNRDGAGEDVRSVAGNTVRDTTGWAGLLFWLNAAGSIRDRLLEDPRLADRTIRWVQRQIAPRLVPVEDDDPVVAAFAGQPPSAPRPGGPPATAEEQEALVEIASAWTAALLERLDPEPPVEEQLLRVARRRGEITADPGWIDVWLDPDEVDVGVRRAGLDLDPDWIPWLGTVVRFRYG